MVLGTWSRKDTLYGGEGYSVIGNGDLAEQLRAAIAPPAGVRSVAAVARPGTSRPGLHAPAAGAAHHRGQLLRRRRPDHLPDASTGRPCPSSTAARRCKADGTHDRQAPGRPDRACATTPAASCNRRTRAGPRRTATRPAGSSTGPTTASSQPYGPINKTTFSETADGSVIRRMPNLVKFREDPDAMLVMSLEDYDEVTGKAAKAAIMTKDVVGQDPARHAGPHRRGRAARLPRPARRGGPALHRHALRQARGRRSSPSWATSSTTTRRPRPGRRPTPISRATCGRSSPPAEAAGPGVRPERRGPAGRAARGRAARRHRRQPRGPVDSRERHPGVRRRALRRRAVVDPGRAPEEGCRLERRGRTTPPSSRSPRRPTTARRGPTAPGSWSWPST